MEDNPVRKLNRPNRNLIKQTFDNEQEKEHWKRIRTTGEEACCVCDKKFKSGHNKVYIGTMMGEKLYRHDRCDCHSENWKKKFKGCKDIINNGKEIKSDGR